MYPSNDPEVVRQQYSTDAQLRACQQTHDEYTVPQIDFPAWVLRRIQWRGDERVLDVGTGTGNYFRGLREDLGLTDVQYTGLDLSMGMLQHHPARADASIRLVTGDAQRLPIADHSIDIVLANHMLYHVPDIPAALHEMKRVLKPGGLLVAATNGEKTMPELSFLYQRALLILSQSRDATEQAVLPVHDAFALENGTLLLGRVFYTITRYDLPLSLVFPEVEPFIRYMNSSRALREPLLPEGVHWEDVMMVMQQQASRVIDALGELIISKISGVLIASDTGGAPADFVRRLNGNQHAPT